MKRFYKEVSVEPGQGAWRIFLDGKPIKNSSGEVIFAPSEELANAAANEWKEADEQVDMKVMPMTRLIGASTSLDAEDRTRMVDEMVAYAETDLLCYWSEDVTLQNLQQDRWEPVLKAVEGHYNVQFRRTTSIVPVQQMDETIAVVRQAVEVLDDYHVVAVSQLVGALGSVLLFLAWRNELVGSEEMIELSQLDELYQAEKWGEDVEAKQARAVKAEDIHLLTRYLQLLSS